MSVLINVWFPHITFSISAITHSFSAWFRIAVFIALSWLPNPIRSLVNTGAVGLHIWGCVRVRLCVACVGVKTWGLSSVATVMLVSEKVWRYCTVKKSLIHTKVEFYIKKTKMCSLDVMRTKKHSREILRIPTLHLIHKQCWQFLNIYLSDNMTSKACSVAEKYHIAFCATFFHTCVRHISEVYSCSTITHNNLLIQYVAKPCSSSP